MSAASALRAGCVGRLAAGCERAYRRRHCMLVGLLCSLVAIELIVAVLDGMLLGTPAYSEELVFVLQVILLPSFP